MICIQWRRQHSKGARFAFPLLPLPFLIGYYTVSTRKLCYHKAMHLTYQCPGSFWMCIENLKCIALAVCSDNSDWRCSGILGIFTIIISGFRYAKLFTIINNKSFSKQWWMFNRGPMSAVQHDLSFALSLWWNQETEVRWLHAWILLCSYRQSRNVTTITITTMAISRQRHYYHLT